MKFSFNLLALGLFCFLTPFLLISQTHEVKPSVSASEIKNATSGDKTIQSVRSAVQVELAPVESYPMLTQQATKHIEHDYFLCEGEEEEDPEVEALREEMDELRVKEAAKLGDNYPNPFQNNAEATAPTVVTSFNATAVGSGYPPDNTMAISNGGYIVVAVNSSIAIYNTSGTQLGVWSLYSFFNGSGAGVVNDFFDPNVLYDSGSDRFFFSCCVGRTSSNSKVLCAFSKSNNPLNGWNNYYLTGNPLNNSKWLDFPRIAYSTNEVYVTGNLFSNGSSPVFNQAVLYQIPKQNGYNGSSLSWQYWYGISGSPFSLMPVSYGASGSYGPGVYLAASNSSSGSSIKFYDLTKDMSASDEELLYYSVTTPSYTVGANAIQKGTSEKLKPGDCRMQNGFYYNGLMHYVFGAAANGTYNGVKYHRVNVSTHATTLTKSIYSSGYDLCYPSVAWAGTSTTDKGVLISFQHASSTTYPGVGAFNVDDAGVVSTWTTCASGTGYVNITSGSVSRWGDYTLLQKKQNSSPRRYWGSASFGNTSNEYTAKVYQLRIGSTDPIVGDGSDEREDTDGAVETVHIFPNPVADGQFQIGIQMSQIGDVALELYDANGKLASTMHNGSLPEGLNNLQFSTTGLPTGVYFVRVLNNQTVVAHEKVLVFN